MITNINTINENISQGNQIEITSIIDYLNLFNKFLRASNFPNNNKNFSENPNNILLFSKYFKSIIKLFLERKEYKINRNKIRKINYIVKYFKSEVKHINNYKLNLNNDNDNSNTLYIYFYAVICFTSYLKLNEIKKENFQNLITKYKLVSQLENIISIITIIYSKLYYDNILTDKNYEFILKFLLLLSMKNKIDEESISNGELANMLFFMEAFYSLKLVFNKILKNKKQFNTSQENIINNIITFVSKEILDIGDNNKPLNYTNKSLLSANDYNTSNLLELAHIIHSTNIKNNEIYNNFIKLLVNIYSFRFQYQNLMQPLIKIIETLLINIINIEEEKQIISDLEIANFPIDLLNNLIKNENEINLKDSCLLNEGFYFYDESSGIKTDGIELSNEFIIFFGFNINNDIFSKKNIQNKGDLILLQVINSLKLSSSLKIWLKKNNNADYEMIISIKSNHEYPTGIIISCNKTYIFSFKFNIGNIFQSDTLKISYIYDEIIFDDENDSKTITRKLNEIKIKSFKATNIIMYIGCQMSNNNTIINKFTGFIGPVLLLNIKNMKFNDNLDIEKILFELKGNYSISVLLSIENKDYKISTINRNNYFFKGMYDKKFKNIKNKFEEIKDRMNDSESKLKENIKLFISPKLLKLFEYKDDIDYLNLDNNYQNFENFKNIPKRTKINIFDFGKTDENKKEVSIFTSFFNNKFHLFENNFTILEFMKYDGMYYLDLLLEYYYQIINKIKEKIILSDKISETIGNNLYNILDMFDINILQTKYFLTSIKETNKFFYQFVITLKELISIGNINKNIHEKFVKIMKFFIQLNNNTKGVQNLSNDIELISNNLFDFLLNLKLYQTKDNNFSLELLSITFTNLLDVLQIKTISNLIGINGLLNKSILKKFFAFLSIFDANDEYKNEDEKLLMQIQEQYALILVEILKFSFYVNNINYESLKQNIVFNNNNETHKYLKKKIKEGGGNTELIEFFFQILNEQKKNPYIFYNMVLVLFRTELTYNIQKDSIQLIQKFLVENYKFNNSKETKLTLEACILTLISKYLIDNNNPDNFHKTIRQFELTPCLFSSLMSSIKQLKYLENYSYMTSTEESDNDDQLKSLTKLNLSNLNKTQILIIKCIFEDIIYLLLRNDKINNSFSSKSLLKSQNKTSDSIDEENYDIYAIFIQNLNIILKYPNSLIFNEIFSASNGICGELFYYKYCSIGPDSKMEIKDIRNIIIDYHKNLLLAHDYPFVFKFLLLINKNNNDSSSILNNNSENNKITLMLLYEIFETLKNYKFDYRTKSQKDIYFICNILNFLILLHKLIIDNNKLQLFKFQKFLSMFLEYTVFLDKIGIIYANDCFEIKEDCGKIACEIIFDLYINLMDTIFDENIKNIFIQTFTKDNEKEQEIYSIFYLIDLTRESILEKEKNIKKQLEKYIPLSNLKYIHKYILNSVTDEENKTIMISGKNINKIFNVNFSIYFFAKCFLYCKKENFSKKVKNFLFNSFLPLIQDNIFRLWTKRKNFYGNRSCRKFLLYFETKTFFEEHLIQEPENFKKSVEFFDKDIPIILKQQANLSYCYSSRLIDKEKIMKKNYTSNNLRSRISTMTEPNIDEMALDVISLNLNLKKKNNSNELEISKNISNSGSNNNSSFNDEQQLNNHNSSGFSSSGSILHIKNFNSKNLINMENNDYFCSFEKLIKGNTIINAKNLLLKNVFSLSFKDILFNDNIFSKIKLCYFLECRNYNNFDYSTKQLNYPSKQKNFSNGLEPKIFLRKDFNFYDPLFFKISHSYMNLELVFKNKKTLNFYPHKLYDFKENKDNINFKILCELVTTQYIYTGLMLFTNDLIIFNSFGNEIIDENNLNYIFSVKLPNDNKNNKNNENNDKHKTIIIFYEDIKEIIKRRSLLMYQSLEIFLKNGKSFFFNFFKINNLEKIYIFLSNINNTLPEEDKFIINSNLNKKEIKKILDLFKEGNLSTYKYLLYLNKYSSRTYNDLTQYPIFPWLTIDNEKISDLINSNVLDIHKRTKTFVKQLIFDKDKKKENNNIININLNGVDKNYLLRDFNYPISMQNSNDRKREIIKFKSEASQNNKFINHLGTHYSTSSYIFYYLVRMNPYSNNLILLQNFKFDSPGRMFSSFKDTQNSLLDNNDNRELIPDIFCYIEFFCNLNCMFIGVKNSDNISMLVDDFDQNTKINFENKISSYIDSLYKSKKILNSNLISTKIYQWVDIIFGKKQLPEKEDELAESCNVYYKTCYEQKIKLNEKLEKYKEMLKNNKITREQFYEKMEDKISFILNFGICPAQILNESVKYEVNDKNSDYTSFKNQKIITDDNCLFVSKISKDSYLLLKNYIRYDNDNIRKVIIYEIKNQKITEKKSFDCGTFKLMEKITDNNLKIYLYKLKYAISYLNLINLDKSKNKTTLFILSCRFLGNYFKIQYSDKIINVITEDFVTCIVARNAKEIDNIFYTGLLNGKLIEWKIELISKQILSKKKKNEIINYYDIKETKHVFAHNSSITAIEIFNPQNIIITSGIDKYIYIRKMYDFELLTAIDLNNSFGNFHNNQNIFPSLIKVSKLNCLYVLLYDIDNKINIIRGYTLNGLFFAQNNSFNFLINQNNLSRLYINNISFTKNSNLSIGFINSNQISLLSASNLKPFWDKEIENTDKNNKIEGTKWIEYHCNNREFTLLYKNEFKVMILKDDEDMKFLDAS